MKQTILLTIALTIAGATNIIAAEQPVFADLLTGTNAPRRLPIEPETKNPNKPAPRLTDKSVKTTGQGFWKFVADTSLMPIPDEIKGQTKPAHGTVMVDAERDIVYWGLKGVGWVGFSNGLTKSWVVKGDPAFARGNIHGAELFQRKGKLPLVVAADNEEGEVYLSDTTFQHAEKLVCPQISQYKKKEEFHPTDATFISENEIIITDGYGKAFFMKATASPFKYTGEIFGGKEFSKTPHGVTYNPREKVLIIAARPEAEIMRYDVARKQWLETYALPRGSTVCNIGIGGDYLLAPCLTGEKGSNGPIYIVNLKTKKLVSTLRPHDDLALAEVLHLHDAQWYWLKTGKTKQLCIIYTNWNPGGVGVLKLVSTE